MEIIDVESMTLKDLPKVFTSTHNPHRNTHANKAFAAELEERLREDTAYQTKPSQTKTSWSLSVTRRFLLTK